MLIHAVASHLIQGASGWRLTYYDAKGDPVASFWARAEKGVKTEAAKHVAVM